MTAEPIFVDEVADLRWLYLESASELGLRATPFAENAELRFDGHRAFDPIALALVPGWISAPVPSPRMCSAANRQSRIRETLRGLSRDDRHIIDAAYGLRNLHREPGGRQLMADFGVAATLAYQVLRKGGTQAQATEAASILKGAQRRYLTARRKAHGRKFELLEEHMSESQLKRHKLRNWRSEMEI